MITKEAIDALTHAVVGVDIDAGNRVHYVGGDDNGHGTVPWALERDAQGAQKFRELKAENAPRAQALDAHSLTAVVDYLADNRDAHDLSKVTVHVVSHERVVVRGPLRERRDREEFLAVTPAVDDKVREFEGRYLAQEDFVIQAQLLFLDTPERAELLRTVGNMTDEAVRTASDDGITQLVITRSGGAKLNNAGPLKSIVNLVPLRTFPEVQLAPVPYLVRVKGSWAGNPSTIALFDASGGAWRVDAIRKIGIFLEDARMKAAGDGPGWGIIA